MPIRSRSTFATRQPLPAIKRSLARGGGIYYVNTATNVANNELVYWDDTEKDVSNSNANGAAFGYVVPDGAVSAGSKTYVIHQPFPLLG